MDGPQGKHPKDEPRHVIHSSFFFLMTWTLRYVDARVRWQSCVGSWIMVFSGHGLLWAHSYLKLSWRLQFYRRNNCKFWRLETPSNGVLFIKYTNIIFLLNFSWYWKQQIRSTYSCIFTCPITKNSSWFQFRWSAVVMQFLSRYAVVILTKLIWAKEKHCTLHRYQVRMLTWKNRVIPPWMLIKNFLEHHLDQILCFRAKYLYKLGCLEHRLVPPKLCNITSLSNG